MADPNVILNKIPDPATGVAREVTPRLNELLSSGRYRDIPGNVVPDYLTNKITEDEAVSQIIGSPQFNPNSGPVVNGQAVGDKFQTNPGSGTGFTAMGVNYGMQTYGPQTPASPSAPNPIPATSIQNAGGVGPAVPPTQSGPPSQSYTVQAGDTLSGIAKRFGVSIGNVTGYRSGNPNLIQPGEVLSVGGISPSSGTDFNARQQDFQKAIQGSGADVNSGSAMRGVVSDVPVGYGVGSGTSGTDTTVSPVPPGVDANDPGAVALHNLVNYAQELLTKPLINSVELFNQERSKAGLDSIENQENALIKTMSQTEDDIRNEITSGGGTATESQVQALVATRNKVLTNQLKALDAVRQTKQDYVDRVMKFSGQDADAAAKRFDEVTQLQERIVSLDTAMDNSQYKKTAAYWNMQKQQQGDAFKKLDFMVKTGTLGNLSTDDAAYYGSLLGINPSLIKDAGTNSDTKFQLANELSNARARYFAAGFANLSPDMTSQLGQLFNDGYPVGTLFKGLGANEAISQILSSAIDQLNAGGGSVDDVAVNAQNYKALGQVLTQEQKRLGAISTYEGAVKEQIPIVQRTFNDYLKASGNRSESQVFNDVYQYTQGKLTGVQASTIKPFYLALDRMATEWAKVTSGSLGSAEVTQSAREHMRNILSPGSGPKTLQGLIKVVVDDMAAQKTGTNNSIRDIQNQLKNNHPTTGYPEAQVSSEVENYVKNLNLSK